MKDVHLPLLQALQKISATPADTAETALPLRDDQPAARAREIAWGRAGGEAEATVDGTEFRYLAVDDMDQCIKILEEIENGKLEELDFLELMSCAEGCVGGPLTAINPAIAKYNIRERERRLGERAGQHRSDAQNIPIEPGSDGIPRLLGDSARTLDCGQCLRIEEYPARPALLLDSDFRTAIAMMDEMEKIYEKLPGLDCGCCGAPNCHALAEDIVRGNANLNDCIVILKEQYRELLEKGGM